MAVEKLTMPQLGESVTEGTISKWLVQPGDKINKYDPIAEVMTDKVNAEVPSSFTGTVKELVAAEGDTVEVGELICYVETEGGSAGAAQAPAAPEKDQDEAPSSADAQADEEKPNKRRYSPAVLRMAQEHDIDLEQVDGSGRGGRITRKDLQKLIDTGGVPKKDEKPTRKTGASGEKAPASRETAPAPAQDRVSEQPAIQSQPGDIEIPVSGVRKAIAQNMVRSKQEVPHAWMMVEADVTELVQYRDSLKDEFKKREGYSLTYFAFFVKAVAQALKEYPQINSSWAGDKIIQKKDIHLSIAVAREDSLFVPVIKHADEKSVKGIARNVAELAGKVRTGKITADEMQGGTFTVNNTGSFGSVQSMGIINYPQAAILQVESIVKKPVVMNNGMIAVRDMVNLCLSLDHRILDGLIAGRFLARVKEILENMNTENTSIY